MNKYKILEILMTLNMYIYLIFNEILLFTTLILLVLTGFTNIYNFIQFKEGWIIIVYILVNYFFLMCKIDEVYFLFVFSKRKIVLKRNFRKLLFLNIINLIFMAFNVFNLSFILMIPYVIHFICLIILRIELYYGKRITKKTDRRIENRMRYQM
jgi:hypothetical protein